MIEGGVDSNIFENFIYEIVTSIRKNKDLCQKKLVIYMDNAVIHRHQMVLETLRKLKCNVLFNAQYSP